MTETGGESKDVLGRDDLRARRAAKRRRSLRRAAITLVVLVVLGVLAWHFILTLNIKRYVIQLLEQKINGTLDFDSFHVNIFTGTVRIKNARLVLTGDSSPFVTVPVVKLDALALRSKDVIMLLERPVVSLKRSDKGVFNFKGIIKPPKVRKGPSTWNISIDFDDMAINFDDRCGIPPKTLANLRGGNAAVARVEQLCAVKGVKPI